MPKAVDIQRLTVTHDPTEKVDFNTGKLPPFDLMAILEGLVEGIVELLAAGGDLAIELAAVLLDIIGSFLGIPNLGDLLRMLKEFNPLAMIGTIISAITGLGGSGGGVSPVDPLTFLGNALRDLMDSLGGLLGGLNPGGGGGTNNPPPLGTGTPTQTGDTTGPGGGTVTGVGSVVTDPAVRALLDRLVGAGAMSSNAPIPTSTVATALSPGAAQNVQTDWDFQTYASLSANKDWMWDWPGATNGVYGSEGCVRTLRDAPVTIYWMHGTWELAPGMSQLPTPNPGSVCDQVMHSTSNIKVAEGFGQYPTDEILMDFTRAEFVVIQYEAAVYPMGLSTKNGTAALARAIRSRPGKFILLGHSQGGQTISNVLDELRYGTLQDRYDDLLFGCAIGSMRHPKGTTFDNAPVYSGNGYGCSLPTLDPTTVPDHWWEMAFGPGTYPAFDEMDGITYELGDLIACLGEGGDPNDLFGLTPSPVGFRTFINFSMSAMYMNELDFVGGLLKMLVTPQGQQIQAVLGPTEAHNTGAWCIQPYLQSGDHRTCWEIMWDHINELLAEYDPVVGNRKQIGGVRFPVKADEVVQVSGLVEWANLPETDGDQIMVGLNCYDAAGQFIHFVGGSDAAPGATITAPVGDSGGWREIGGEFIPVEGTATARIVAVVEPQAMTTGVVTFDRGTFAPTGFIAANLIKGLEDLHLLPENVRGPAGEAEFYTFVQNLLDGMQKATTGTEVNGVQLAQVLTSLKETAENARNALELAQSLATGYQGPVGVTERVAGNYTFDLPPWITDGDIVDIIVCGAGGGAQSSGIGLFNSQGGRNGTWAGVSYVYGTHIPDTVDTLDYTVGEAGGPGAPPALFAGPNPGATGGGSTVSATGMTTVTGTGGLGGGQAGNNNESAYGLGPGDFTDTVGSKHFGGHTVAPFVGLASGAQYGAAPGGGGAGVNAFVPAAAGGGADGYVSIRVRRPA